MKAMTILLIAMTVIYGGLMLIVAMSQFKNPKLKKMALIVMLMGGAAISLSTFIQRTHVVIGFYVLVVGLILVHLAAIQNGMSLKGAVTFKHHVFRLVLSSVLCLGYYQVYMY